MKCETKVQIGSAILMMVFVLYYLNIIIEHRREKTGFFAYAKTKAQICFAVPRS